MHIAVCLVSLLPICFGSSLTRCSPPSGEPTCVCKTHHGTIDLTKITQNNGSAKFADSDFFHGYYHYQYNPCFGFSVGSEGDCNNGNTAICQDEKTLVSTIDTEAMYYDSEGNYELHYSGGDKSRTGIVYLHCDEAAVNPIINTTGDSETPYLYLFNLYTNEACIKKHSSGSDDSGYIGAILISLALTGLLAYFIIGGIILKFHQKKSGTDIIPNKRFWFSLPFLVKIISI
ncbi:PREDICTED: uncharacterized protein LOC105312527 isoform X2 [Amphimedon queenslandica]|uniref:Autophagy-related protein 27 n=1 Tax=Amphimedon queenslandica TaxID=400682 RepID=A0AAN0J3H7_AMPQE|nr:PREDICTED: uncharacterized protein LOC105312527 isoform X2 [Amphimedon queenslandica]|eukprot:XP_019851283.1 PREDICTED: uncharacterized protein LOC105312527 isoform X2 [Amphimedon queenslandica]